MGAFLDKPKTEKETSKGEGNGLRFGVAAMQGWRVEMEDAHSSIISLSDQLKEWSFFGVFDGHAGSSVSRYCADNLHKFIFKNENFQAATKESSSSPDLDLLKKGIVDGFLEMDAAMRELPNWKSGEDKSGSTAVTLIVTPAYFVFANCGDSRGILFHNGEVLYNTVDHKPSHTSEKDRIEKAGGSVMIQRINGALAVSRALGDFEYKLDLTLDPKAQLVSPEPDVFFQKRGERDEFVVLACDGVWDVMSNCEVGAFVRSRLQVTDDLEKICCELLDTCLTKGSRDNMSVVILLLPGSPKVSEEAIKKEAQVEAEIEKKVKGNYGTIPVIFNQDTIVTCKRALVDQESDLSELDVTYALQNLSGEDIEGLPPGGGLASKAHVIQKCLEKLIAEKSQEKGLNQENSSMEE